MNYPSSTYRIQFNRDFTFADLRKLIPYLDKLGIGAIYASPILASTPGSTHGYDGVNPGIIDPELGTLDELKEISGELSQAGIKWLQDIVPNHMAFHSENPWLMDVLEKGQQSVYASFFDIAWNNRMFHGKIMVPFLTKDLSEVIASGGLGLAYLENRLVIQYEGSVFPLNLRSYQRILSDADENQPESIQQLLTQLREINDQEDPLLFSQRWNELLLQLASLAKTEQVGDYLDKSLKKFNGEKQLLQEIADLQTYALCHWQSTEEKINFRRFFTVNGLICLNMQQDHVFEEYHQLIKELLEQGVVQGLRIDHIDGLFDPAAYLDKLRAMAGKDTYIIAEKILEAHEELPASWPIEGTTGYEFLAMVNNLLTNRAAEADFDAYYKTISGEEKSIHDQLLSKKSEILNGHMGGELENLYQLFVELELADQETLGSIGKADLKKAIGEILIHCPVYRFYGNQMPLPETEKAAFRAIIEEVAEYHPSLAAAATLIGKALLDTPEDADQEYQDRALEFYQRCMQFSGPLMAKGGEDTLMYTNHRFIGHNEVGDFPDRFGIETKGFHKWMTARQKQWPFALNATSTHDTKRGEDVRARLNVLTDLYKDWLEKVQHWEQISETAGTQLPHQNDRYLIYQTILGAHPMPGADHDDFSERIKAYLQKALREGKVNSSWSEPDEQYEQMVNDFVSGLLNEESAFYIDFQKFLAQIADYGVINSLSQLTLKFTCPGIPDLYQGCELWDLSMVDPDNRREVDYQKRIQWLDKTLDQTDDALAGDLWQERYDGRIKLWLTQKLFELRQQNSDLFTKGEYIPLKTRGEYKQHLLAFARKNKKDFHVIVVPLHAAALCQEQGTTFFELDWKDTTVVLPDNLAPEWENVLGGGKVELQGKLLPSELFKTVPVAILKGRKIENERKAGVLLHITSLASPYGVGDLGPEAFQFADMLARSDQKLWQLLPLNPTEASQANSPYSALSSRAGNPLLISPDVLAEEGLLDAGKLSEFHQENGPTLDYEQAGAVKMQLLEQAFSNYKQQKHEAEEQLYQEFCEQNAEWLPDFALYMALKKHHDGAPWYEWTEEFRLRDEQTIASFEESEESYIHFVKWQQYVFDKQWKKLRGYCNALEIQLIGDLPFYVSYDSADVWANKELFCLDEDGKITGVAGVPPDAFSDDGQLWGMPVFNWKVVEDRGYQWWIDRLKKNVELFDLVRLDHFRAFADYWEVPGGEKTAVNGKWQTGPGEAFFVKIKEALGRLPFIAEDLGEISPEVYQLRDQFALPGMKVLQFAFDENMPQSEHIPHNFSANFIAYSGTHDNNTVKGWFRESGSDGLKERLGKYVGREVNEDNAYAEIARLVYGSVAKIAILPMQDVLNLDEKAKMNSPGSSENNWGWRLLPGQFQDEHIQFLTELTVLFNRD